MKADRDKHTTNNGDDKMISGMLNTKPSEFVKIAKLYAADDRHAEATAYAVCEANGDDHKKFQAAVVYFFERLDFYADLY